MDAQHVSRARMQIRYVHVQTLTINDDRELITRQLMHWCLQGPGLTRRRHHKNIDPRAMVTPSFTALNAMAITEHPVDVHTDVALDLADGVTDAMSSNDDADDVEVQPKGKAKKKVKSKAKSKAKAESKRKAKAKESGSDASAVSSLNSAEARLLAWSWPRAPPRAHRLPRYSYEYASD